MKHIQKESFIGLGGEGDNYFNRNKSSYSGFDPHSLPKPFDFYGQYIKQGDRILEIGCANGRNLVRLANTVDCEVYGVDPSVEAVNQGKMTFPDIHLTVATADDLPFLDGFFDFVLFGFCLYLVDRGLLAKVVFEADRVLKNQGFIGITDFDPIIPAVRPYRYKQELNSYKMDYSRLFTVYPHYSLVGKVSFSHHGDSFEPDPTERLAAVVIYKDLMNGYYPEADI